MKKWTLSTRAYVFRTIIRLNHVENAELLLIGYLIIFVGLLYIPCTFGQNAQSDFSSEEWRSIFLSPGGFISTLEVAPDGGILIGTYGGAIYRTKDKGEAWEELRAPQPGSRFAILDLAVAQNLSLRRDELRRSCIAFNR
jgi:hypothetical protein